MSASRVRRYGGRLVIAAALSALVLPGAIGSSEAASAAKPKKGSSWKTVRTENFKGSALPKGCEPYTNKYSAGKNAWSAKDVVVSGGKLQLKLEKKKTSGQPYRAGAIGCWGWPQKYGRYEITASVPAGKGIASSLTLSPAKSTKTSATSYTALDVLAASPETAYLTNGYGSKSESTRIPGTYSGKFRTYVIEWAPKHLRMTVDGKEIFYSTRSFSGSRWLGLVVTSGDGLTGVPDATTKLPARLQIDRIKISSYTGVPPKAGVVTPVDQATPTVAPTARGSASPVPSSSAGVPTAAPSLVPSAADTGPGLAGGIWPWLLGGSLIAVFAIVSLNYPYQRRAPRDDGLLRH